MTLHRFRLWVGTLSLATLLPLGAAAQVDEDLTGRLGLGLRLGTHGVGAEVGVRVIPNLTLRGTFDYLGYQLSGVEADDITADFELNMTSVGVIADFHPWKERSFKVFAGAFLYLDNYLEATGTFNGDVDLDDGTTVSGADLGTVTARVEQSASIAPVFGLGFGRAVPKRRIGFGVDLGAIVWGDWETSITPSNPAFAGELNGEAEQLNEDVGEISLWPYLKFNLTVRLF